MHKRLEGQFAKSGSRYLFNIDRIAEKYCNASNRRELALETLQRNFGDGCISSPVVELKDESNRAICQRLNEDFEIEYGKRMCLDTGDGYGRRSVLASDRKLRSHSSNMLLAEQCATVGKYTSNNIATCPSIANMLVNSVEEESYEAETKRLRIGGPIRDCVIDVITSPIKEGPVKIRMNNHLPISALKNNTRKPCSIQSSSDQERFTLTKNETFLHAWFRNAKKHWTDANFVRDHSFRWRSAYNARRSAHRNLGYVNMSNQ